MNAFSINLATKPFRNNAMLWLALGLSAASLSAFTWYTVQANRTGSEELETWTVQLAERQAALRALVSEAVAMNAELAKVDLVSFNERSSFANSIIISRIFSWSKLFERLEEVLPYQVRLRSVRPAVGRHGIEVSVDGASRDQGGLLEFEERLIESPYFSLVYPLMETSRKKEGEIQFNIAFAYLPAGPVPSLPEEPEAAVEGEGEGEALSLDAIPEEGSPEEEFEDGDFAEPEDPNDAVPEDANGPGGQDPPGAGGQEGGR